jgi:hypothetical protein
VKLGGRLILVATIAALVATLATPAGGRVVPQRSIAGVRLQMTRDQVRHVLGKPRGVKNGRNQLGRFIDYRYRGLLVRFQGLRTVTMVTTSRRTERTARGVGVGSTKRQVRSRVGGVHCRFAIGARFCFVGVIKPGRRLTTFYFNDRNRVTRLAIGLVVD